MTYCCICTIPLIHENLLSCLFSGFPGFILEISLLLPSKEHQIRLTSTQTAGAVRSMCAEQTVLLFPRFSVNNDWKCFPKALSVKAQHCQEIVMFCTAAGFAAGFGLGVKHPTWMWRVPCALSHLCRWHTLCTDLSQMRSWEGQYLVYHNIQEIKQEISLIHHSGQVQQWFLMIVHEWHRHWYLFTVVVDHQKPFNKYLL